MDILRPTRLLSIGEFAAATQLSAKALRLYAEQDLLRPTSIDSATGYRYYASEQVPAGRLIRALRDMDLSLLQIAKLLGLPPRDRESLLREFLYATELRYARERQAYHEAYRMMRASTSADALMIDEQEHGAEWVGVWSFSADRHNFIERCFEQRRSAVQRLTDQAIQMRGLAACVLLEPLTDDETSLELLVPIDAPGAESLTTRHLPPRRYAVVAASRSTYRTGFTPEIDCLFDWFDRHGHRSVRWPEVELNPSVAAPVRVRWAFETAQS
jgi:DNA-binding transcriptional MerR regulator